MMAKQQAADTQSALNIVIEPDGVIIKRDYGHNARAITPPLYLVLFLLLLGSFFSM